jgi:AcrR family transcriptional regulator
MNEARRYDPEAARGDILDAAERLFVERGFGEVSTAEIARAASVAQSQIHYHFRSKRNLWQEVFRRGMAEYHATQAALLQDDAARGLERMGRSIEAYFRFFQRKPDFAKLMMRAYLDPNAGLHSEDKDELFALGTAAVAEGQAAGLVRDDVPPAFILLGFLSLVAHYFQVRDSFLPAMGLAGNPADHDEAYLRAIKAVYLRGISI